MSINVPDLQPLGLKQVNTGATPDDGQGDTLPVAFEKHNYNMQVLASQVALKLSADRTYYVSPTLGSDANNGLLTSTPFYSVAAALNAIYALNLGGHKVTIKLMDGVYSDTVLITSNPPGQNPNDRYGIYIEGNTTTPDAVTWQYDLSNGAALIVTTKASVNVSGIRFAPNPTDTAVYSKYYIESLDGALVGIKNVNFGAITSATTTSAHIFARDGSIEILGAYKIFGAAKYHIHVMGGNVRVSNTTVTPHNCVVSNTPAFTCFYYLEQKGFLAVQQSLITYTGSASGYQYIRDFYSPIFVENNLPNGMVTGITSLTALAQITTPTPLAADNSALVPNTSWVQALVSSQLANLQALLIAQGTDLNTVLGNLTVIKTGMILLYGNPFVAPTGYLLCDGSEVSRTTYINLYNTIGVTFGSTSGSTFTLPDFRGRVPVGFGSGPGLTARPAGASSKFGEETHVNTVAEMPSHFHYVTDPGHAHAIVDPGHAHAVYDPGHAHSLPGQVYDTNGGRGAGGDGSSYRPLGSNTYAAASGVAIYPAATGITSTVAAANISFTQYTGAAVAANNMQPSTLVNYIIKI